MARERIVVIGAGLAGGKAVQELRRLGFDGAVELIGTEEHIPYERPPLSKGYVAGRPYSSRDLLPSERWYTDQDIILRQRKGAVEIERDR